MNDNNLNVTFGNIESAPNQNQTQPTTQAETKTKPKTQTESAKSNPRKTLTAHTNRQTKPHLLTAPKAIYHQQPHS